MVGQGDIAAPAPHYESAITALYKGGCSSAVEEQDHLFPRSQGFADGFGQGSAEDASVALSQFTAEVYDLNLGERGYFSA
jgi:hypothetical protein